MDQETKLTEAEEKELQPQASPQDEQPIEGEFKVTVRKLEVPVRPRGVLAD